MHRISTTRKVLAAFVFTATIGIGAGAAWAGSANAVPAGTDYTGPVYGFAAGQCLDVANAFGNGTSGLKLQTWTCGAVRFQDQVFHYDHTAQTLTYVATNGSLECVVPSGASGYDVLQLGSCTSAPAVTENLQSGFVRFDFATSPATTMDVKGKGTVSGTPVGVFGSNGGANQQWHVIQNPGAPAS